MQRVENFRNLMKENGLDGMLLTSQYNLRYLTNFTGTAGLAVISMDDAVFITDFRYVEQAGEQAQGYTIVQHEGNVIREIASQVSKLGIKKLGFEEEFVTYKGFHDYEKEIRAELVPVSGLVEKLRMIKDQAEIDIIKEAAQIVDDAFEHILTYIRPGVSELDVSNELEFFMRKRGATSSAFDTIVASGERSALPHGVASEKRIEQGDFVTLDYGAYYKGYCSDTTRTIAVGEPSDKLKEIYAIVLEAQQRGVAQIKQGMTGKEADAITRDYIHSKGYGEFFGHSTGHGLGLEVHEGPTLSIRSVDTLQPGMVVTIEPGVYLSGVGGVRIEDDVLITKEGNEVLTHAPKELIIV